MIAHKSFNSPCDPSRAKRCHVHRIPPRVRDDRDTPLLWGGTVPTHRDVSTKRESDFFSHEGLDSEIAERPVGQITSAFRPSRVAPELFLLQHQRHRANRHSACRRRSRGRDIIGCAFHRVCFALRAVQIGVKNAQQSCIQFRNAADIFGIKSCAQVLNRPR